MPNLTNAQMAKATQMLFGSNAATIARVMSVSQADADAHFTTVQKLRDARVLEEIRAHAKVQNRDGLTMILSFASETAQEFEELCKAHHVQLDSPSV